MATMTIKKKGRFVAMIMILCLVATMFVGTSGETYAASKEKTKTYSNDVFYASGGLKALDIYGRDTLTVKYNGNKVISCKATQSAKNLGTKMCEAGGIKCTKKTATKWTYRSTWYLNFSVLPKPVKKLLSGHIGKTVDRLTNLGRCMTVVTEYTVDKNGKFTCKQISYKLYVPSNIQKDVKWIAKNLVKGYK